MADFWVIGPIAWDRVLRVPHLPSSGGFVQATEVIERPGGAGANVAIALASTGAVAHMVGYVGDDEPGARMRQVLDEAGVDVRWVQTCGDHTSEVLILVEPTGERSIVGLWPDVLRTVPVPVGEIRAGDVAYFAAWHEEFRPVMQQLADAEVTVATVPPPHVDPALAAAYLIGSRQQFGDQDPVGALSGAVPMPRAVVVTEGAAGVTVHDHDGSVPYPARQVDVVDTTGAGDAFAAGFLYRVVSGAALAEAVSTGITWATAAVQEPASIPPTWSQVAGGTRISPPKR